MRALVQGGHADIVHRRNPAAHEGSRQRKPQRCQRRRGRSKHRRADHEDANQKRQQGWKHQIVDRGWQPRRQHADEMHGPDGDGERNRCSREQQAPAHADRRADLDGKAQADKGALDRHNQRQCDEPGLVRHRHRLFPPVETDLGVLFDVRVFVIAHKPNAGPRRRPSMARADKAALTNSATGCRPRLPYFGRHGFRSVNGRLLGRGPHRSRAERC